MLLNFLPFLSMRISGDKLADHISNISWSVPVFIFCYSPYCSICNSLHPSWDNLSKLYKDDPKIMIAEIDCNSFYYICESKYRSKAFPNFIRLLKGIPKTIHPDFNYDGFTKRADELKNLNMNELCERFPLSEKQKYPALVLSTPKSKAECCAQLDYLIKEDASLANQIFCIHNAKSEQFDAYMNHNSYVTMDKNVTTQNMIAFSQEYRTPFFTSVRWSEILKRNRTIVIIITEKIDDNGDFKSVAEKNSKKFYFQLLTRSKYNELSFKGLKKTDVPALVVGAKKKDKFAVYTNISPNNVMDIAQGEFGKNGVIVNKKMSSVFHDFILFPGRSRLFRYTMYALCIAIIVGMIIGGFFLNSTTTLKFE